MIGCVVVADDLTGANAVGVLMTKENYRTYSITNAEKLDDAGLRDCECIVYPTDSRSIPPQEAYDRVFKAARSLRSPDVQVYAKRIDTTLRGNLGSETDAMLDALGDNRVARRFLASPPPAGSMSGVTCWSTASPSIRPRRPLIRKRRSTRPSRRKFSGPRQNTRWTPY